MVPFDDSYDDIQGWGWAIVTGWVTIRKAEHPPKRRRRVPRTEIALHMAQVSLHLP